MAIWKALSRRPAWVIVLTTAITGTAINGLVVWLNPPAPRVHDEFSYLLAADTFASGRLTNPTHEHWRHFETMHVIQRPSYASKYPPGQGLVLAAAKLATGSEIAGVCVTTGLAAAATAWMLLAWFPKRWAALGGLIVALHPGIQLQWGMSYWGGALAMTAGALVVGGAARLARAQGKLAGPAVAFATGAVLLAVTRPFEGFVLTAGAVLIVLAYRVSRQRGDWLPFTRQAVLPVTLIGGAGIAGLLAYNQAVTGDPLRMPYQIHEADYGATPLFLWQEPTLDHEYHNDPMRRYHLAASMWWYDQQQTLDGLVTLKAWLIRCAAEYFFPAPIVFALLAASWTRRRQLWPWIGLGAATWAAACLTVWMFPHYLAPITPLIILLLVAGVRSFRLLERRLPVGRRWLTPAFVGLQALLFCVAAYDAVTKREKSWAHARQAFSAGLESTEGDDLVFVRYSPDHNVHNEWVYNDANMDGSPIVWARELSAAENAQLMDYYADRKVWVVMADEQPLRLVSYEAAGAVASD